MMNIHADKTQENNSQSVANSIAQKQSSKTSTFQFMDNRPEAITQRELQEMANNSDQVKQLRALQHMANTSAVNTSTINKAVLQKAEKKEREKEEDVEASREAIQKVIDNDRQAIGKRIIITDNRYGDRGTTGTIERYSSNGRNLFAVRLDGKSGLWRVDYRDMDYLDESSDSSDNDVDVTGYTPTAGNSMSDIFIHQHAPQGDDYTVENAIHIHEIRGGIETSTIVAINGTEMAHEIYQYLNGLSPIMSQRLENENWEQITFTTTGEYHSIETTLNEIGQPVFSVAEITPIQVRMQFINGYYQVYHFSCKK